MDKAIVWNSLYMLLILLISLVECTPPPGHIPTAGPIDLHPPKYDYGYIVSDHESTQGHVESRDGIFALGRYHVTLPDGSGQKVTYFADDWGYHPLVSYSSSTEHGSSRTEFAMGDKAVEALKQSGSPVANLISSPKQTSANQVQQVVISNVGASGHQEQSQSFGAVESTTAQYSTTTASTPISEVTQVPAISTTSVPPLNIHVSEQAEQANLVQHQSILSGQSSEQSVTPTPETAYVSAQSVIQQQEDIQHVINKQQQDIQELLHAQQHLRQHQEQQLGVNQITSSQPISAFALQHISVTPSQQTVYSGQSHLGSILLQEVNTAQESQTATPPSVQIVTPTSVQHQQSYNHAISSSGQDNSQINTNDVASSFVHQGHNVQITSYLADTNRVLNFGDRLRAKDRQTEQRIIDQIQEHAKLRIFQDLQKNAAATSTPLKPIIVTGSPVTSTEASTSYHGNHVNVVSYGNSGYNSVPNPPQIDLEPPRLDEPNQNVAVSNSYLETNSIQQSVADKSDYYSQNGVYTVTPSTYNIQQYLAPLQAGLSLITAPERTAPPPVNEDTKEETYRTVVDVQKGLAYDIQQAPAPNDVGQYQALGYEQRLVNADANALVNERNPVLQQQKAVDLANRQGVELRQLQESLQVLQQQIVNDIDAQHEEEQRKQEAVNQERQSHMDNLQKVEQIINDARPTEATNPTAQPVYQGPEYLPPHPTAASQQQYPTGDSYGNHQINQSYQNVYLSSTGQQIQEAQNEQANQLQPPPAPPSVIEIEKPVLIEKPVAVESTKLVEIEKPVYIKEAVPIETTKLVEVERPVLHPYPVPITRLVHVERPVAVPTPYGVPQPMPFPYAVEVPIPHLIPYPEIVPYPVKQYHPVYIHTKTLQYKHHNLKPSKRMPEQLFKEPRPELYQHSHDYHTLPLPMIKSAPKKQPYHRHYYKSYPLPPARSRNALKNLRIEYGGFKPPLIPSAEYKDEPKPSIYGPSVKED